jgi:hypothetical protein
MHADARECFLNCMFGTHRGGVARVASEHSKDIEQHALRLGYRLGPDPSFDPMSLDYWTPVQAIAWIGFDIDTVRVVSTEARRKWLRWKEHFLSFRLANFLRDES